MRIYLDLCTWQRPFDDQAQFRVRFEAEAIQAVIGHCAAGRATLVGSIALDMENARNPHPTRKAYVASFLVEATEYASATPVVERDAERFVRDGLKTMDALHLACAVGVGTDYFCTCDDRFLKRARTLDTGKTRVVNPLELCTELGL